jgi:hypothetical protein
MIGGNMGVFCTASISQQAMPLDVLRQLVPGKSCVDDLDAIDAALAEHPMQF